MARQLTLVDAHLYEVLVRNFLHKGQIAGVTRITRKIQIRYTEVLLQTRVGRLGFVDLALSGRHLVAFLLVNIEAFAHRLQVEGQLFSGLSFRVR